MSKKIQNHNSKVFWNLNGRRTKMHDNNSTKGRKELKCSKQGNGKDNIYSR